MVDRETAVRERRVLKGPAMPRGADQTLDALAREIASTEEAMTVAKARLEQQRQRVAAIDTDRSGPHAALSRELLDQLEQSFASREAHLGHLKSLQEVTRRIKMNAR